MWRTRLVCCLGGRRPPENPRDAGIEVTVPQSLLKCSCEHRKASAEELLWEVYCTTLNRPEV